MKTHRKKSTHKEGLSKVLDDVNSQVQGMLHLEPQLLDVLPLLDLGTVVDPRVELALTPLLHFNSCLSLA